MGLINPSITRTTELCPSTPAISQQPIVCQEELPHYQAQLQKAKGHKGENMSTWHIDQTAVKEDKKAGRGD